jgi:hypothetical protein
MMVDPAHAYNYWRKVFVDSSDGQFTPRDFDRWFRNGAKLATDSITYLPTTQTPGSKEHFNVLMRTALNQMLEACSDRRFGKRGE